VKIASRSSIVAAARRVQDALGGAAVLVNNAGVMLLGPFSAELSPDYRRMIETNLRGAITTTEVFLDQLIADGGDLVNLSSVAGPTARPGNAVYAATKWGMNGWSESLRQELQPEVRVIVIEPGAVLTELTDHITHAETKAAAEQMTVCGRETGVVDGLADLALVAVGGGGVDVPIADIERGANGVSGLLGGCLEDAQVSLNDGSRYGSCPAGYASERAARAGNPDMSPHDVRGHTTCPQARRGPSRRHASGLKLSASSCAHGMSLVTRWHRLQLRIALRHGPGSGAEKPQRRRPGVAYGRRVSRRALPISCSGTSSVPGTRSLARPCPPMRQSLPPSRTRSPGSLSAVGSSSSAISASLWNWASASSHEATAAAAS
jgi:short chain dehydrogenase